MAFVSLRLARDFARCKVRHAQGVVGTTGRNTGRHRRRIRRETGIDALAWRLHTRSLWLVFLSSSASHCTITLCSHSIESIEFTFSLSHHCRPLVRINRRFTNLLRNLSALCDITYLDQDARSRKPQKVWDPAFHALRFMTPGCG
jgi:hypothetical protein